MSTTFFKAFQIRLVCAEIMCDSSTGLSQLSQSEQEEVRLCSLLTHLVPNTCSESSAQTHTDTLAAKSCINCCLNTPK